MAHSNTILSQVLREVPRHQFQTCVKRYGGDRRVRRLSCWGQFVALLSAQLSGRSSLRDLVGTLSSHAGALYHAGLGSVKRSTLADANENRPHEIFRDFFLVLSERVQALAPRTKLRIRRKLFALDSTLVSLCLSAFPWARFRRRKGAVKLHTLLNLRGEIPAFVCLTNGKTHDARAARRVPLPQDSLLVIDRAYVGYAWLKSLLGQGVRFITRLKKNAAYRVVERRKVDPKSGVLCDQTIRLTGPLTKNKYPAPLRRIAYRDPETGKRLVFLTNDFSLAPLTVAKIYKARWQIELFFKWIKQNLKIKTFLGTSVGAVQSQIWIALIAYLLLAYLKFLSKTGRSLQEIKRLLETTLFERRPLREILHDDYRPPPPQHPLPQLSWAF